jgi:CheY-like chemotaxis protein
VIAEQTPGTLDFGEDRTMTDRAMRLRKNAAVRALVVDDSPELLEVFCALLALQPEIQVVGTAGNGVEALQIWAELQPELVLMDVTMPQMDGITAAMLLQQMPNPPRIILMSSEDLRCTDLGYSASGAEAFVFKPQFRQEFPAAFRTALAGAAIQTVGVS